MIKVTDEALSCAFSAYLETFLQTFSSSLSFVKLPFRVAIDVKYHIVLISKFGHCIIFCGSALGAPPELGGPGSVNRLNPRYLCHCVDYSPSTTAIATARVNPTLHMYAPLMPYFHDASPRMLQSVAESDGLAMNPGFCEVHGEYDMMSWSYFHVIGLRPVGLASVEQLNTTSSPRLTSTFRGAFVSAPSDTKTRILNIIHFLNNKVALTKP